MEGAWVCSEAEARSILAKDGRVDRLIEIVEGAWKAHVAEKRARHKRTRASIVWEYMIGEADLQLAGLNGVRRTVVAGTPMWAIDDQLILRFKKHDRERLTRNIPTDLQRTMQSQRPIPGLPPEAVHVSCGYMLDLAEAGIEQILTTKRMGGYIEWWIDMHELASGVLAPRTPALPLSPSEGTVAPLPGISRPGQSHEDEQQ
jgi:hypothetical protein